MDRIHGGWSYEPVGRRKEDGSWGWEKEGMSSSISTTSSRFLFFFLVDTFFPQPASYFQPTAYMSVCVCVSVSVSACVLEVRFGARAIKALLKHFWCCWLMLKLKEEEKKEGEEVRQWGRERTHSAAISACSAVHWQPVNTMSTEVRDESTT